jgi:C4-dicarboxylate-specific signal transduction histidine kinase
VAVNDSVATALKLCGSRLHRGVAVEQDLDAADPRVRADARQLEQVLANLLINAADAMSGQPRGTLRISSRVSEQLVTVVVEDTGPGIAPDMLESIWEPFVTTKDSDSGTGLGLFICRGIVEKIDGKLSGDNRAGGGARFTLELPAAPPASREV